jgi:hypothetical protein
VSELIQAEIRNVDVQGYYSSIFRGFVKILSSNVRKAHTPVHWITVLHIKEKLQLQGIEFSTTPMSDRVLWSYEH